MSQTSLCSPQAHHGEAVGLPVPALSLPEVNARPHDGEVLDFGPRAFVAGGDKHPGFLLAKGAGPGIYNRWSTCTAGKRVLFARVQLAGLA